MKAIKSILAIGLITVLASCTTIETAYQNTTPEQLQSKAMALTQAAFLVYNSEKLQIALSTGVGIVDQYALSGQAPDPSALLTSLQNAINKALPAQYSAALSAAVIPLLYGLYQSEYRTLSGHNQDLLNRLKAVSAGVKAGLPSVKVATDGWWPIKEWPTTIPKPKKNVA